MFKSVVTLALRSLWKNKLPTLINVLGLSIGLTCCLLVALFVQHDWKYDKGFDSAKDIYRVTSAFNDGTFGPTVARPYPSLLKNDIPEIENVSSLDTKCQCVVQLNGAQSTTPFKVNNGYWVDTTFFKMFSFHFLYGDRRTVFKDPNVVVLSESLAHKFYGNIDPVGKTLKTAGNTYTVSGVFKEDILNHLKPDFFASNNSTGIAAQIASFPSWVIEPSIYTYIKLKPGSNYQHVLNEIADYTQRHAGADMRSSGIKMTNSLQALTDIHLHSSQYFTWIDMMQVNQNYIYMLASIALAILLLGCINYMNLSSAQAIERAREIGVRRVLGAGRVAIRVQFLIESIVVSMVALILAIGLGFLFLPSFNYLVGQSLSFFAAENRTLFLWMFCAAIVTGFLAGIYPSLYLSAVEPIKALKGKMSASSSVLNIRQVMVCLQFAVAACLVFGSVVIWQQYKLLRNAQPGFDKDQQLVINEITAASQLKSKVFIDQLATSPLFKSVTGAAGSLISGDMNLYRQDKTVDDKKDIVSNYTDANYTKTLGLQFISGSGFAPANFTNTDPLKDWESSGDIAPQIILNEAAVKVLGLNPYDAPGKYLIHRHNGQIYSYRIMGVVKNYHYLSMHNSLAPSALMPANPMRFNNIIAKMQGQNADAAVNFARKKWRELNPETPFDFSFLDKVFNADYDQDQNKQTMLFTYTGIAIFISCMGLLGLITFTLNRRLREISVRKVIGATVTNIVMLFYKQYFRLVFIANLIGLPVAWYFMSNWLNSFPYRISLSWWMCLVAVACGATVAILTITFQTIKAALVNPAENLKAE